MMIGTGRERDEALSTVLGESMPRRTTKRESTRCGIFIITTCKPGRTLRKRILVSKNEKEKTCDPSESHAHTLLFAKTAANGPNINQAIHNPPRCEDSMIRNPDVFRAIFWQISKWICCPLGNDEDALRAGRAPSFRRAREGRITRPHPPQRTRRTRTLARERT